MDKPQKKTRRQAKDCSRILKGECMKCQSYLCSNLVAALQKTYQGKIANFKCPECRGYVQQGHTAYCTSCNGQFICIDDFPGENTQCTYCRNKSTNEFSQFQRDPTNTGRLVTNETHNTVMQGDCMKCQSCNDCVILQETYQGKISDFKCLKCTGYNIITKGNVKAGSAASCTICTAQFICMKDFLGQNPQCPRCRINNWCRTCNSKIDVLYQPETIPYEIYDNHIMVWMCKSCRWEKVHDS